MTANPNQPAAALPSYGPCSSCQFAKQREGDGLECRRHPPRPHVVLESTAIDDPAHYSRRTVFPSIGPDDGCGEHRPASR